MESNQESIALAKMINDGTKELRQTKLQQLQKEHAQYLTEHGYEHPDVLEEMSRVSRIEQKEANDKKSIDAVLGAIQMTNDVEAKLKSITDPTANIAFQVCIKEFGAEKAMQALEKHGGNPFQTIARLRGYPDVVTMVDEMKFDQKAFVENLEKQR